MMLKLVLHWKWLFVASLATAILVITTLAYSPGLSGPFTLDDNSNLLTNEQLKIKQLDHQSLRDAAFSIRSGPTGRPVSMLSFALNYYFSGSFENSTPYKITNLAIHLLNSGLVFWLMYLLVRRLALSNQITVLSGGDQKAIMFFCAAISLVWAVHPIQLTSVLYVVQRMTALSGTFVLLSLIAYIGGRKYMIARKFARGALLLGISLIVGTIGVFAKENAALLPLYLLAIEATLFGNDKPWTKWHQLHWKIRLTIITLVVGLGLLLIYEAISYSLPGYSGRPYTITERLMTEARVVVFYLFLIVVPRINAFGLHHDDIAISSSLISPWTTLPSILLLIGAFTLAVHFRRKYRLVSLGIYLFLFAHLLESTIYPLDIAYEHRNYIAGLGVVVALAEVALLAGNHFRREGVLAIVLIFIMLVSITTFIRATHWRSDASLYAFEALHHPNSAILNFELAGFLQSRGEPLQAVAAARKAVDLNPDYVGFRIFLSLLLAKNGLPGDTENEAAAEELLHKGVITPTTYLLLRRIVSCINKDCPSLAPAAEKWLRALTSQTEHRHRMHEYLHMYGVVLYYKRDWQQSEDAFLSAIELKPGYTSAYRDLASLYGNTGFTEKAVSTYELLLKIDPSNELEYTKSIETLTGSGAG